MERGQEKKLREGNIARRQLFAEMQNETTLHLEDDMREPFRIGAELVHAVERKLRGSGGCSGGGGLQRA